MLLVYFCCFHELLKILIFELGLYQRPSLWNLNIHEACRGERSSTIYYYSNASMLINLPEFYECTRLPCRRYCTEFQFYCRRDEDGLDITKFQLFNIHTFYTIWNISFRPDAYEIFTNYDIWVRGMYRYNQPWWMYAGRSMPHPTEVDSYGLPADVEFPYEMKWKYYESGQVRWALIHKLNIGQI